MKPDVFKKKVAHNTSLLIDAINNGDKIISILPKLYTWDSDPGDLNSTKLLMKGHDMLPAVYLGLLSNTDSVGPDAYMVTDKGKIIPYELKTSEIKRNQVWQTVNGTLYLGTPGRNTKVSLASRLSAKYQLHSDSARKSKNLKTVLFISDSATDGYIDAYEIDGDTASRYIDLSENMNRQIKLRTFMTHGTKSKTVVEMQGYQSWIDGIRATAPIR